MHLQNHKYIAVAWHGIAVGPADLSLPAMQRCSITCRAYLLEASFSALNAYIYLLEPFMLRSDPRSGHMGDIHSHSSHTKHR